MTRVALGELDLGIGSGASAEVASFFLTETLLHHPLSLAESREKPGFAKVRTTILGGYRGAKHAKIPRCTRTEFWDKDGIYKHIKDLPEVEEAFFRRLVRAIRAHTKFCTQTTVLLDDLRRFNSDHDLELSAPALCVYGCLLGLQWTFPRGEIEAIFDKFEGAASAIGLAKDYLQSDVSAQPQPGDRENPFLSIYSLEKKDSWRNILPLQAADWLSWEMRKTCIDTKPWIEKKGHDLSIDWVRDFNRWAQRFYEENGRSFRNRKSFIALREANPPQGHIWNYEQLGLVKDRHPYGWALRGTNGALKLFTAT